MKCVSLVGLAVILLSASAARLDFQTNPSNVIPVLTKLLRIRCAVQLQAGEATIVRNIERRQISNSTSQLPMANATTTEGLHPSTAFTTTTKRPTTHAPITHVAPSIQVSHITSIIISRRDKATGKTVTVARVSPFDAPTATVDQGYIQVEGSTNLTNDRELGHLEVSWQYPTEAQVAEYTCDVNALDFSLYPVSLTGVVRVTTSQVSTPELAGYVAQSQKTIDALEKLVAEQALQLATLKEEIKTQAEAIANNTDTLNETISDLKAQNIQTGVKICAANGTIQFPEPFSRVPAIFTSLSQIQANSYNFNLAVTILSVSSTGFDFACTATTTFSYSFSWFAVDN